MGDQEGSRSNGQTSNPALGNEVMCRWLFSTFMDFSIGHISKPPDSFDGVQGLLIEAVYL